jgi:hypothetical protein
LFWDYLLVAFFGLLIGGAELVSRYRDAPFKAIWNLPAVIYIVLNVLAAIGALWTVRIFDISFGLEAGEKLRWTQVFVAGFGSMALFRSSIFVFRVGDDDVSVGPNSILSIILSALDQEVDRVRGQERARTVAQIIEGISFNKARHQLPTIAISLLQNLPRGDQDQIRNQITLLAQDKNITERAKILVLGLTLMDFVGVDILKAAVDILREEIEESLDEVTPEELLAAAALLEEVDTLDEVPPVVEPAAVDDEVNNPSPGASSGNDDSHN